MTRIATDPLPLDFGSDKPLYVYLYRDPRPRKKRQPIYVGKGTAAKGRADHHWRRGTHNPMLQKILNKISAAGLRPIVEIVGWFDAAEHAFALERELIARIGRRDLGAGPLSNMTDGGDGGLGMATEARKRAGEKLKTRIFTAEHRRRISEAKKGSTRPDNAKRNKSLAGRRFTLSLSPEQTEQRRQAGKAAAAANFRNLSPERMERRNAKISETVRRQWEAMTHEQREARRRSISRSLEKTNGSR